jgi:hypothetical protein
LMNVCQSTNCGAVENFTSGITCEGGVVMPADQCGTDIFVWRVATGLGKQTRKNLQRATYTTQHATRNGQHTPCNMQHATCNIHHATHTTQHATRNVQHTPCNTQLAT